MRNRKVENGLKRDVLMPSQRHELIEAIERTGEIPLKFAYLDTGADVWDAISKDDCYDLGKRELTTLKRFLHLACGNFGKNPFNILHIGSGNGIEIPTVVENLGVDSIVHYGLVDISPGLLKMAEASGNKHFEGLKFLPFLHDVTKPNISKIAETLRQNGASRNLVLLIANGAILSNSACLNHIRKSMTLEDRFLITLEIFTQSRDKEILEQYKLPSIIILFAKSLSLAGINHLTSEELEFVYNKQKSEVEVYFLSKHWLELHGSQNVGSDVSLPERIKIFSSFRPTTFKLKKSLLSTGFKIESYHYFQKERCCGIVCKV